MITPKEKAVQLLNKMKGFDDERKINAITAVEEIIKEYESLNDNTNYDWDAYLTFWDDVKGEIEKL